MKTAMPPRQIPRILLVEDDATSRAFLTAATQGVPATVDAADSMAAALALAATHRYDLWLFDAHLPDGSGSELLARVRLHHSDVPALAHTASTERAVLDALIGAGFAEVLVKPLPAAMVQSAVRRMLGVPEPGSVRTAGMIDLEGGKLPIWDDETAARALNFNRAHVEALRGLFLDELPPAQQRIQSAARVGDHESLRAELHKLRAGCGFVGAARLDAAVRALQQQFDDLALLERFDEAAQDTLLRRDDRTPQSVSPST